MQVKATMMHHLLSVRWLSWKRQETQVLTKMWLKKGTLVGGDVTWSQHNGKQNKSHSKKLKIDLLYDLAVSLRSIYPEKWKNKHRISILLELFKHVNVFCLMVLSGWGIMSCICFCAIISCISKLISIIKI